MNRTKKTSLKEVDELLVPSNVPEFVDVSLILEEDSSEDDDDDDDDDVFEDS